MIEVTMVRVYFTEAEKYLQPIMKYLQDEAKVKGATVFRAITGYGESGSLHTSSLLDLSLDLPLVVEFFDKPERIASVLTGLKQIVEPGHIVRWPAVISE